MKYPLPALLLLPLISLGCASAPEVPAADRLDAYSDEPYAAVLDAAVVDGMVDYPAIVGDLDRKLDVYLNAVARFGPESAPEQFASEKDELAYYLNAYNAIMLRLWLDKGARTTDADDKVGWLTWFTLGHWRVDRRTMSLHHLEQGIIRPDYEDARIHGALVCGAIDCPPLLDEPFTGDRLDEQLDAQMRVWLNDPAENAIEIDDEGTVRLAAIFGWYRDDFRETGGLEQAIEQYLDDADPRKEKVLAAIRDKKLKFQGYDWTINLPENVPATNRDAGDE